MGSRLRPVPEKIFECLVEVTAPHSEKEGAELKSFFPDNYEDVDMLKDVVTKFCFPFAHDAEMVDAVQHFAFVLTDIDGFFRFGFCRYPPKAKTCLCILSDLPAFEMFYGILNTLAELENTAKDQPLTSKQFLDLVLDSQVPEPGTKFTVSDPVIDWTRQYNYPDPGKLPTIPENRNLTDYFSAVNPSNMIALFASMMFERRIIVTSKRLSLLTACTYSASLLLYPMHWQHVFIPVMPPSLLDYCSAPMPFLVGVHSSLMEKVRDMPLDDVVILDIDKEEIELSGDCFHDVDDLPSEAVSKLNSALKKNTIAIGEYVARAFLGAVVILIGGYRDALKLSGDTIIFREDMFLTSRPHMKSFLENLLKLQLFERFIHHRLDQLNLGEAIDDVFEEQIGLQTESDSKWVTQYKHWMKNRKRHGTQLLNSLSGKTEQATYRAKKFIHAGVKHGKNGFKEAVKGMKEKKKKEKDGYDNSLSSAVRRTHSLPMSHANAVSRDQNFDARNSVGSALQNRVNLTPSPTRSQRPERPPPRVPDEVSPKIPPRQPPPRPPPMRRPSPPPPYQSREVSNDPEVRSRPSMVRNPGDPGVKDLINFYDSQEDITAISAASSSKNDPFAEFTEFDYLATGRATPGSVQTEIPQLKVDSPSSSDQNLNEGFFSQTMCALSDDTRQFLRSSRLLMESQENTTMSQNASSSADLWCSPRLVRKPPLKKSTTGKKTLREIALEQKVGNGHVPFLTHASSEPSLLVPVAGNMRNEIHCSKSSTDINRNSDLSSNVELLTRVELDESKTNNVDPFLELISQRHSPQQIVRRQNGPMSSEV